MDLTRVIIGPVLTEKSERLKPSRVHMLRVAPDATKIDVKAALRKFYDVDVSSVRVQRVVAKRRAIGAGKTMTKRHPWKKVIITLSEKSKALDLADFKTV